MKWCHPQQHKYTKIDSIRFDSMLIHLCRNRISLLHIYRQIHQLKFDFINLYAANFFSSLLFRLHSVRLRLAGILHSGFSAINPLNVSYSISTELKRSILQNALSEHFWNSSNVGARTSNLRQEVKTELKSENYQLDVLLIFSHFHIILIRSYTFACYIILFTASRNVFQFWHNRAVEQVPTLFNRLFICSMSLSEMFDRETFLCSCSLKSIVIWLLLSHEMFNFINSAWIFQADFGSSI